MPLVEEELLTLPVHPSSPPDFSGVHPTRSIVFCVVFYRSLFVLFLLAIVLSILLWYTDFDYPLGIFKLFLCGKHINNDMWPTHQQCYVTNTLIMLCDQHIDNLMWHIVFALSSNIVCWYVNWIKSRYSSIIIEVIQTLHYIASSAC